MKKLLSVILVLSLLMTSLFTGTALVSAETTVETAVKNEFRILADGNTKDTTASMPEYLESELASGILEGVVNTTNDGEGTVRVLKAGEANVFRLEVDKDATAIQINDFKLDSKDGALYQYHFYLSDDGSQFNIIGSYNGANGRSVSEYGNNFSWSKVDQGWIRYDNNIGIMERAPLNADGTKKVVYLKLSSKGGNSEDATDINANGQVAYVGFTVQTVVPATSVTVDRVNGDIIDEVRIVAEGNTKDTTSAVPEYFESELASEELQGEVVAAKNQENQVRILKAGEFNIFKLEIDKNASAIQINDIKVDSEDGGFYHYHFYISNDGVTYYPIASYDGNYGRSVLETGDNFSWESVDQSYSRDVYNKDITDIAPLNEDGTKKVIYLKVSSKGGAVNNPEDISEYGQASYTSFTVQSVIAPDKSDVSDKGVVVCVGDSLTESVNVADSNTKYPSILGDLLGDDYIVYNQGVGGSRLLSDSPKPYTSETKYLKSLTLSPDIVVIMLGTNDCADGLANKQEQYVSEYLELINTYENLESKPKVYVCLSPSRYDNTDWGTVLEETLIPLQKRVAEESGCELIDIHGAIAASQNVYQDDNLHFNPAGNRVIAKTVLNAIKVYEIPGKENLEIPDVWEGNKTAYEALTEDGAIDYAASLAKAREAMAGEGTASDPEIITTADQLYAVIAYGGQGYTYKLANDIYLNADYENYASWTRNQEGLNTWIGGEGNDFHGTLDGDGHTVYGYYANTDAGTMLGFIPTINTSDTTGNLDGGADVVVIKNLHIKNAQVAAARWMGVMVGVYWTKSSGSLTVNGCTVSDSKIIAREERPNAGGIIGLAGDNTTISNSAVYGVEFVSNSANDATVGAGYAAYGAITAGCGWNYTAAADFNAIQAENLIITNCVSVNNTMSGSKTGTVYPVGIGNNRWEDYQYSHTVSAKNIYTDVDVTDVPVSVSNSDIKLLVTTPGGTEAIAPDSEAYPIKNVSADAIKGEAAKTAMPELSWALYWSTVEDGYPIPQDKSEGKVWDGTKTTSIDGLGMAGSGTEADPYVITNGAQLYGVIFSGGNGHYYVIANDIVLNDDYMNYKSWGASAPTNKWTSGSGTDFLGHIDGNGYTIYGFYATGGSSGLIPRINNEAYAEWVTIENINMSHSFIGSATGYDGFIVGNIHWGGSRRLLINGCNVRNSKIEGIANNSRVGGIIGAICNQETKINNCSVANVEFTASDEDTGLTGWDSMGSIVGSVYTGPTSTGEINPDGAVRAQITNSFAVNCVRTNDSKTVYPVGIFAESETKYFVSVGAKNVYTDADVVADIPSATYTYDDGSSITFTLKVASVDDTSTAIDPTAADYPIKNITADGIKGENAKTAMPELNWCYFDTVSGSIPIWADNHTAVALSAVAPTCTENGLTQGSQCSACGEILAEQEVVTATGHGFSGEWVAVDGGKQLTCLNCDEAKFMADITADGATLTTEAEVFEAGTALGIEKLTQGTDYDAVMAAIPSVSKIANVYNLTAALDGANVNPNGIATLSISVPAEWNSQDVVICLLTSDGKLRKMTTTLEDGVATADINLMGVYTLVNLNTSAIAAGDLNADGSVDSVDLTLLRKLLIKVITADEIAGSADVNGDGKVNLIDLVVLKKALVEADS